MARRKRKINSEESSGGWMTTFSDLMTLLLCFFVLLFSMSSVSNEKFTEASQSMQSAFLGTDGKTILDGSALNETIDSGKSVPPEESNAVPEEVLEMYEQVEKFIEEKGIGSQVAVSRDQDGIYVNIQESILFQSGRAEVTKSGKTTLDIMAELLMLSDNALVIEGYTDNIPMNTEQYGSNWELSTGRAVSVLRYLSEENGIEPTRLSAKGYGEHNPTVPNDTAENRAKNRRVNIVIVHEPEEEKTQ